MVTKVMFVSRATAEATPGWPDWAIISITEPMWPGEAKLMPGWHSICRVNFHDVDPAIPCGEPHQLMNEEDALKITQFVRQVAPGVDGILVHCKSGVSRSAAVAKWIARQYDVPFNHRYDRYNKFVFEMLVKADKLRLKPIFTLAKKDEIVMLDTHIQKEPGSVINDWSLINLEVTKKMHLVGTRGSESESWYAWVSDPAVKVDLECGAALMESGLCYGLGERHKGYPAPEQLAAIKAYSKNYAQAVSEFLGSKL